MKIMQYSLENTCVAVSEALLIKLQAFRPATLFAFFNTFVFLLILRDILRTSFPIEQLWWLLLEFFFSIYAILKIYEDS